MKKYANVDALSQILREMKMANKPSTGPHIAVLAFPFSTHAAPLLAIIKHIAKQTPTAHISFFNTSKSNSSILATPDALAPNIIARDISDGVSSEHVFTGKPQEEIELFLAVAEEEFRRGMAEAVTETGREVSCLITDAFFWFAADIAADLGVSWLPFWTAGPDSLSAHVYTDLIRSTFEEGGIGREDEPLKFVPGMSKLRVRDLPEGVVFGRINSIFSQMLHKMGRALPQATAVFINSFEELDLTITNDLKAKFTNFLNVGPFNLLSPPPLSDHECISWLNNQNPMSVVYISFGSVTVPPQRELDAISEALEEGGVPFLWSLKDDVKSKLPNGFLERTKNNGLLVDWTPQLQVLAHEAIGVFVTHCGWNSLLESVTCGVPLICRPFFGDQRLNAGMAEEVWEIGVNIVGGIFTKDGLLTSLELVLFQDSGEAIREKIKGLKQLAEAAIGTKGSSTENLAMLVDLVVSLPN